MTAPPAPHRGPDGTGRWRRLATPVALGWLLLTLAGAGVMTWLGVWQLRVSAAVAPSGEATAARTRVPPVPLPELLSLDAGLSGAVVGRRVIVKGSWQPADQVLISRRRQGPGGQDCYWVVTPVRLDTGSGVLVVRGWATSVAGASRFPVGGSVRLVGSLIGSEPAAAGSFPSGAASAQPSVQPRVLPELRVPGMVALVDYRLYDAAVVLQEPPTASGGLTLVPPPPPSPAAHDGLRNVAYGLQWFVFAGFAIYLWWRYAIDSPADPRLDGPSSTVES